MRSLQKMTIIGDIGLVQHLHTKTGESYLLITVACNRSVGPDKPVVVTWYSVLLFGKLVANVDSLLRVFLKGRLVYVEGLPKVEAFIKKDGTAGYEISIQAEKLPILLDRPPESARKSPVQQASPSSR